MSKLMTPQEVAERSGLDAAWVRKMCRRQPNPLPCIDKGTGKRNHYRIDWDRFMDWLTLEERRRHGR